MSEYTHWRVGCCDRCSSVGSLDALPVPDSLLTGLIAWMLLHLLRIALCCDVGRGGSTPSVTLVHEGSFWAVW